MRWATKGRGTLAGRTIADSQLHPELEVVVVGVLRPGGVLLYNPRPNVVLEPDAVLIALGPRRQLDRLEKLAGTRAESVTNVL